MVTTLLLQIYYEIDLLFKSLYQVLDTNTKKVSVILGDFFLVTCPIYYSALHFIALKSDFSILFP